MFNNSMLSYKKNILKIQFEKNFYVDETKK